MVPEETRVVIQGFGNVGGMAASLMAQRGFKIIAIVEWDGAVYNPAGLDIAALDGASQGNGLGHRFRRWRGHRQNRSHVPRMRCPAARRY